MDAGTVAPPRRPLRIALPAFLGRQRLLIGVLSLLGIALGLILAAGARNFGQVTINGFVTGSYLALGAIGLTLVYGILRLVNFAHGDFLTFGAYLAVLVNVGFGLSIVLAVIVAVVGTALLGIGLETVLWRPMRAKGAGVIQLILISIGLAFLIRNAVQFIAGTSPQPLHVDTTSTYAAGGFRIGQTELIVVIVGFALLILVGLMLRYTRLGKQMRAVSDDFDLAESSGINTGRIVVVTWIFAGGMAGLAGVLYTAAVGTVTPNTGFHLLLPLFAAVVLGGIGNAYGALAGGVVIGLFTEWSTLVVDSRWKLVVGFVILIAVLIVRPQGIFGQARTG